MNNEQLCGNQSENTCEPENAALLGTGHGVIHAAVSLLCDTGKQLCVLNAIFLRGKLFQRTAWFVLLSEFFEKSMNILRSSIPLYNFKLITSYYCNFIHFILPPGNRYLLTSNFLYWFQLVSFHITIMAFHSTRYGAELCFRFEMGHALIKLLFLIWKKGSFKESLLGTRINFWDACLTVNSGAPQIVTAHCEVAALVCWFACLA